MSSLKGSMLKYVRKIPKPTSTGNEHTQNIKDEISNGVTELPSSTSLTPDYGNTSRSSSPSVTDNDKEIGEKITINGCSSELKSFRRFDSDSMINRNGSTSSPGNSGINVTNGFSSDLKSFRIDTGKSISKEDMNNIPTYSKLLFVSPVKNEDNMEQNDPKMSGIDISSVLNQSSGSDSSPFQKPVKKIKRRIEDSSDEETTTHKKVKIEDDSDEEIPSHLTPETIDKLIETYKSLFPELDNMEILDEMRRVKYDFSQLNKRLDEKKNHLRLKSMNMDNSLEYKRQANIKRNEEKMAEKLRKEDEKRKELEEKQKKQEAMKKKDEEIIEKLRHLEQFMMGTEIKSENGDQQEHTKNKEDGEREKGLIELMRNQEQYEAESSKKNELTPSMTKKTQKSEKRMQNKKIWQMKGKNRDLEEDGDEEGEDFISSAKVYESEYSSDEEESPESNDNPERLNNRSLVLNFFNEATVPELMAIPGCSKKKVDVLIEARHFESWDNLVFKLKEEKFVTTDLLNSALELLIMRDSIARLMKKCESIGSEMHSVVSNVVEGKQADMQVQPSVLGEDLQLKPYQLIGLNWLILMYHQGLNGVLADEMGLGKTIQAISFLAYLLEQNELEHLCLIVVPTSTLDNWAKELEKWCPSLGVLVYHGSQDERRGMRSDIFHNTLDENIHILLTTYNMVVSSTEDKGMFKKVRFHTVIFDEAHMLKNMSTQRFENLMRIKAYHRILLTGTPLQNNLVELMSILVFVMPDLFEGKKEMLKKVFSMFPKSEGDVGRGQYEKKRITQAHKIMKPFFLRRLKVDVLKDLPTKIEELFRLEMAERQQNVYTDTVSEYSSRAQEIKNEILKSEDDVLKELTEDTTKDKASNVNKSSAVLMTLRKIANHPLLVRSLYNDELVEKLANKLQRTTHRESVLEYIIEDLKYMSDFEIHKTCLTFQPIKEHKLSDDVILESGKFRNFDQLLTSIKEKGERVLIFSQFVIMLNIIEEYMRIRKHTFFRLDGSTQQTERQGLIDEFNENDDVFAFLLSTRAGGLGINLTTANNVILHDIDFNPYNDKQAEDRCHRVGQTKNVTVYRYLSKGSIEEGIYDIASQKLQLERDVTEIQVSKKTDVLKLLESALQGPSSS